MRRLDRCDANKVRLRRLASALSVLAVLFALPSFANENPAQVVGTVGFYLTETTDTFVDLAQRFDVGYVELRAANPDVDPWLPGEGRLITLPTMHLLPDAPHRGIVINIGELRLYFFPSNSASVTSYPIGIGQEGKNTPEGTTRIVDKRVKPTWIPPPSIRLEKPELPAAIPPGPDNPLGDYALYTGWSGYLIHGTNKPAGVGRRVSHGCIRLYPTDIAELFKRVAVGTPVTVVNQAVKVGWVGNDLYLEVHPSLAQANQIEESGRFTPAAIDGLDGLVRATAGAKADRVDWDRVLEIAKERSGTPERITR